MYEYQFNVAFNGHHLFRTDWDTDATRVNQTRDALLERFPQADGFHVSCAKRSRITITVPTDETII